MALGGGSRWSGISKNRLDTTRGALWQGTVGSRTDLKIMVSPDRIRVPPLLKVLQNARKHEGSGFVAGALCEQLTVEVVEEQALYEGTAASYSNLIEYVRKMFLDGVP
jgi:hypothetical protein